MKIWNLSIVSFLKLMKILGKKEQKKRKGRGEGIKNIEVCYSSKIAFMANGGEPCFCFWLLCLVGQFLLSYYEWWVTKRKRKREEKNGCQGSKAAFMVELFTFFSFSVFFIREWKKKKRFEFGKLNIGNNSL